MPLIDVVNREALPPSVVDAMDQHNAALAGLLYTEHKDDGTHSDITADSIVVDGPVTAEDVRTPLITGTGESPALTIAAPVAGDSFLSALPRNPATAPSSTEQTASSFARYLNVSTLDLQLLGRLNLGNRADVTLVGGILSGPGDGFEVGNYGPDQICYRIAPGGGGTILRQIQMSLGASNAVGSFQPRDLQMIVVWNDTGSTIYVGGFISEQLTGGIFGGPITLADQGSMLLVFDGSVNVPSTDGVWRIIGVNGLGWASYTPEWVSNGTNPDVGAGSVSGRYRADGHTCDFEAEAILGAGFSFGTGSARALSLPLDMSSVIGNNYKVDALYLGSTYYPGQSQIAALGGHASTAFLRYQNLSTGFYADITATVPFTWTSGHRLAVSGRYPI